jgi:hypothetical protein
VAVEITLTEIAMKVLAPTMHTKGILGIPSQHVGVPVAYYREDSGTVDVATLRPRRPIKRSHVSKAATASQLLAPHCHRVGLT